MNIRTVGVLGCGLMGAGIAQVCAAAGYKTIVREVDDITLKKGLDRITGNSWTMESNEGRTQEVARRHAGEPHGHDDVRRLAERRPDH